MSLFMKKHAIESKSSKSGRKSHKRSGDDAARRGTRRVCRVEELEKREYLAVDPISVGIVYAEQYQEDLGDKFYVAWVGGEEGCTTLDSLVINLDKNANGRLDEGEAFFDTTSGGQGVYSAAPFTVLDKTENIGYDFSVEDGGMVLQISFTNFHAGDHFVFSIDLDEYQTNSSINSNNAQVEGGEMGGSIIDGIEGSLATATFSSDHYQTETWTGMFVDDFDTEYARSTALTDAYDRNLLPFDLDDKNEGVDQAGIYNDIDLTPKPIVISGYVYADHDVDCNYDRDENDEDRPLANVGVTLVSENGEKWTTRTDVNGYYEFNSDDLMPGKYQIFSESNIVSPEGLQYFDFCAKGGTYGEKITPLEIDVDGMLGGDVAPENNFAKALVSRIEGYVFEDRNDADGKNEGESWDGIAYPAKIELWRIDTDANGVPQYTFMESQTVDAEGHYSFKIDGSWNDAGTLRKLPEKTYEVREIFSSPDYSDGKDYVGTLGGDVENDVLTNIFVGYGENGYHYDFGELKLGSIAGNVWEDRNDNGVIDPNENGIAGVVVELYQWNGASYVKIDETRTDEDGSYLFEDLDICCEYAVKEIQPAAYSDGKDSIGSLGGKAENDYFSNIEIGWDQHGVEYNFGELKLGSIAGNVYEDRNDNGVIDDGEAGIGDVTVELYQWDGQTYVKIAETQTAEDGSYIFENLDISREYAVREKQPTDYVDGKDSVGSLGGIAAANDYIEQIDVQWDDHGVEYNFGELKLGSISGYVYNDKNDNGVRETGEPGIPDVLVELYQLQGDDYVKIAETTTDSVGFYKFDSLDIEQTYAVREIQPENWRDGKDSVGSLGGRVATNDELDSIRVLWDQHGREYNFGELLPYGSLSGYVYEDDNNNGVKNDGEAGIKNVVVQLYALNEDGTASLVATQQTDENGFYRFLNLEPETTYIVRETQPTEYYDGKDAVGTIFGTPVGKILRNDEISDIDLPAGGEGVHYDFGELRPGAISGYVYEDLNDNGIKEAGEAGIKDVDVTLMILNEETGRYEETGRVVKTDAAGHYIFDNLEPARIYKVVETQPSGYDDGKDTAGSLGGVAENDVIVSIPVAPGDYGVDYNFGELIPDPDKPPYKPDGPGNTPPVHVPSNLWAPSPTYFPYIWYQPTIPGSMTTLYGGGGGIGPEEDYSWKLNVLNGGSPRSLLSETDTIGGMLAYSGVAETNAQIALVASDVYDYGASNWTIRFNDGTTKTYNFGVNGAKPVVGDWNGSGFDKFGLYRDGDWYLATDGYTLSEADDFIKLTASFDAKLGRFGDEPVVGDWDGDGKSDLAVFGPQWESDPNAIKVDPGLATDFNFGHRQDRAKNVPPNENIFKNALEHIRSTKRSDTGRAEYIRYDLIDHVFRFGERGDVALAGDWTGEGRTQIGYYRDGEWYLDLNGNGKWDADEDMFVRTNAPKDATPVVGDWNGDGLDNIGYFVDGRWFLDVNGDYAIDDKDGAPILFGDDGDTPVVGDWDGDGIDELGVYREQNAGETVPARKASENVTSDASVDFDSDFALQ